MLSPFLVFLPDCCNADAKARSSATILGHEVTLRITVRHSGPICHKNLGSLIPEHPSHLPLNFLPE